MLLGDPDPNAPTTCPRCKREEQYHQFCSTCQDHFGPNTPYPCPNETDETADDDGFTVGHAIVCLFFLLAAVLAALVVV